MRAPRIEDSTAFYHVGSRGNDGRWIFGDDHDRRLFLVLLERTARRHGWIVLAYCLMTNHFHLVIRIPDGGLSAGMQLLNTAYSQITNARYGSTGHLFRNRFGSKMMFEEAHLLEGCRYVVLNPVRAGICARAEEWPWSSYRASAGLVHAPAFLAVGELLGLFAPDPEAARRVYCDFVSAGHVRGQTPVRESDALVRG
jgi:REP-associated tyrosine transposase